MQVVVVFRRVPALLLLIRVSRGWTPPARQAAPLDPQQRSHHSIATLPPALPPTTGTGASLRPPSACVPSSGAAATTRWKRKVLQGRGKRGRRSQLWERCRPSLRVRSLAGTSSQRVVGGGADVLEQYLPGSLLETRNRYSLPPHVLWLVFGDLVQEVRLLEARSPPSDFARRTSTCPSCRTPANSTSHSHSSSTLVDMFLSLPGNEDKGRTMAEKGALDRSTRMDRRSCWNHGSGTTTALMDSTMRRSRSRRRARRILMTTLRRCSTSTSASFLESPRLLADRFSCSPCPCCAPVNEFYFIRETKIPDPDSHPAPLPDNYSTPGHASCLSCRALMPSDSRFGATCSSYRPPSFSSSSLTFSRRRDLPDLRLHKR